MHRRALQHPRSRLARHKFYSSGTPDGVTRNLPQKTIRPVLIATEQPGLSPVTKHNRASCCVPSTPSAVGRSALVRSAVRFLPVLLRWARQKQARRQAATPLPQPFAAHSGTPRLVFPALRREFFGASICSQRWANLQFLRLDDIVHKHQSRPMSSPVRDGAVW
jgi:hypothetical protein